MTSLGHSDVLVIGAGSAGSVVAERLSVDPGCTVAIVEAGPGPAEPGIAGLTANGMVLPVGAASPVVARFETALTLDPPRRAAIVRGATAGGSGAVNGGYFCRALPVDFAEWNLAGWTWSEVIGHYRAIETDLDYCARQGAQQGTRQGTGDHGDSGPIPVRRTREITGSTALFLSAAERAGVPWLADLNAVSHGPALPTGAGAVPLNIVAGMRRGPGAGFLEPALLRPNVVLHARTRVVRLRVGGARVHGVEVVGPRGAGVLTADKVVLCAGAIGSGHLLMLSGIGPEPDLRAAGVPVQIAAPVGRRSADHPEWVLPAHWAVEPRRPVLEAVLSTSDDLEIRPYTGGFIAMVGDGAGGRPDWPHIGVAVMHPGSRGRVSLVSSDPAVPPRIEHRYDTVSADVDLLRRGAGLVAELLGGTVELGDPMWSTSQHLCGTAPMGRAGDPDAVVDAHCRLIGVDNLWVVDGSVLPAVPRRGPHATTVMLAHRAAGFVRGG
ncbi:mycofactocin dehydrogenase MftG [Mycolicibacterium palauense]|uniref:mycofactocin dehydrogenase MftG n=1 Tax=Mycolicibacterium palauense TaxID=2034511 RepID=UPI000BFEC47C|nr:mycofactocin system GMC family oxidoreductase MftG [Mycolicibacterium palauense]